MSLSESTTGGPLDVLVIGGGQAGLAVGYYLRRTGMSFAILDAEEGPGGAWRRGWNSLRAFSPARYSSLSGHLMAGGPEKYPTRDEVVSYLADYEERYGLLVHRPVMVEAVERRGELLAAKVGHAWIKARAVVSTTGTWSRPHVPDYPGRGRFRGEYVHSAFYRSPEPYAGKRVLVVGGGNSGAQILAEVSKVAKTTWVTLEEPHFLPDEVDGRILFERATERYRAARDGRDTVPVGGLGDVVMVLPVKEARERGVLRSVRPFERFVEEGVIWSNDHEEPFDAVIWCTGFRPALDHLEPLGVVGPDGRVEVKGTHSTVEPRLWLVGYGDWTGFASATLVGVGRSTRSTVNEVARALRAGHDLGGREAKSLRQWASSVCLKEQ
jgi:putative flavoprotein involved in K+ transport